METFLKYLLFWIIINKIRTSHGAACGDGTKVGKNTPKDKDKDVDPNSDTGLSILALANDNEYTIQCCGFIKQWNFYAKTNTGSIQLQVWRPGTSPSYSLQGGNDFTVTAAELGTGTVTKTPTNANWIAVNTGDILGWYTPATPMVTYDNGQQVRRQTGVASSATYNWGSVAATNKRDYGINAVLTPGNTPSIDNLPTATPVTFTLKDDLAINTVLMTLTVSDADTSDTLTTTMTTSTAYFNLDNSLNLKTIATLAIGTHILNFEVTDTCGNQATGIVMCVVTNNAPVIHGMTTATATIKETLRIETEVWQINVTDASLDEFPTCDIQSVTPTSGTDKLFTKLISGTSIFGIFVKDEPGFHYDTVDKYDTILACTDEKDTDTAPFTVYIQRNQQPNITNLQNSITVSTTSVGKGTIVFNVSVTDPENDSVNLTMSCLPTGGPFVIFNSGAVVSNTDLTGTTVTGYDCSMYAADGITLVGPQTLTITISDINHDPTIDNLPLISPVSIGENAAWGSSVFQVSASDQNSLDQLTYTANFSPGVYASYLVLEQSTGLLTTSTTNTIDYENPSLTPKTATLTITVSDGQTTDTKTLQVIVTNVNEAPVFVQNSYSITGNEGAAGSVIGTPGFEVTDPEGDALTYSIDCTEFSIDATSGEITLASNFDTDSMNVEISTTVSCNVTCSDGSLQDNATLHITIVNINDNSPIFSKASYIFYANANDGVGVVLTNDQLTATDADAGKYGQTTLSLDQSGLAKTFFDITSTGYLIITSSLLNDYYRGVTLTFSVTATDSGNLTDTAVVKVIISEYSTTTTTTEAYRYKTFFEETDNIVWFTILMLILCVIAALCIYYVIRMVNWSKLLDICKHKPKRTWKWTPAVEDSPGGRLPAPEPRYIQTPIQPPIKKQSGVKWNYWKDSDFETGNLG